MNLIKILAIIICILDSFGLEASSSFPSYENHPCIRDCSGPNYHGPMECDYSFLIESYMTMSLACGDCPMNTTDCYNKRCVTADGVKRAIKTVNRMIPGPSIIVCQGDLIKVNVTNHLNSYEATSIHWHGIRQMGTPHMDGISLITQCAIAPNMHFQYRFHAYDEGTHFWHAHSSVHRSDGVSGALIVRPLKKSSSSLYDHDLNEHIIHLTDWVHQLTIAKFTDFERADGSEDVDSILINGKGVVNTVQKKHLKRRDSTLPSNVPRSVFTVESGKRYRMRMINAGSFYCPMLVSIQNHSLSVIATDGHSNFPMNVSSFIVLNGERIDFVVEANQTRGCYWIKVKGLADCADTEIFQTAVLKYANSACDLPSGEVAYNTSGPDVPGKTLNPFNDLMDDDNYIPINEIHLSNETYEKKYIDQINTTVSKKIYIGMNMNHYSDDSTQSTNLFQMVKESMKGLDEHEWPQLNNITFKMPDTPYLFKGDSYFQEKICNEEVRSKFCPKKGFCTCPHAYQVNVNDVVEIVLVDEGNSDENHPIHFHGNYFAVVGMEKLGARANIEDVKSMDVGNKLPRNLIDPPIKDTVTVPSGGYTIIRFHADNPGFWLLHCHVQFHSETGMMMAIRVGMEKDLPAVPHNWPQCNGFVDTSNTPLIDSLYGHPLPSLAEIVAYIMYAFFIIIGICVVCWAKNRLISETSTIPEEHESFLKPQRARRI